MVLALAGARLKKHWSQAEAADKIGVDAATLSRWETGKVRPSGYNIRRLCSVYNMSSTELGLFEDRIENGTTITPVRRTVNDIPFLHSDLTMQLLSLAFTPFSDYNALNHKMTTIIEDVTMQHDELTRREALSRLATLPILACGLSTSPSVYAQNNIQETLNQCAAGITACRELSKGKDTNDLALAYKALSAYIPTLDAIVKGNTQYRKQAAHLAAQASRIRTTLGRLCWRDENLSTAAMHAQNAVDYARETDDVSLLISSIISQAWVHYYAKRSDSVKIIHEAVSLLKKKNIPRPVELRVLSTQAVLESRFQYTDSEALKKIQHMVQNIDGSDYYTFSEDLIPEITGNEGMTLYHNGQYEQAFSTLERLIDTQTTDAKMHLSGKARGEMLNVMALASMKQTKRDMHLTIHLWKAGLNSSKVMQSTQRFNECLAIYDAMEAVWPKEKSIKDLQNVTSYWS